MPLKVIIRQLVRYLVLLPILAGCDPLHIVLVADCKVDELVFALLINVFDTVYSDFKNLRTIYCMDLPPPFYPVPCAGESRLPCLSRWSGVSS
jgi:hypothetical protein